jgi:hypothetical protein
MYTSVQKTDGWIAAGRLLFDLLSIKRLFFWLRQSGLANWASRMSVSKLLSDLISKRRIAMRRRYIGAVLESAALILAHGAIIPTHALADFDGDGTADIVAVTRRDGTKTSIHVLSGASGHQRFVHQTVTALHATDSNWVFKMADIDHDGRMDLVAINRKDGDRTAIHVLSFASNYQQFVLQVKTALHATDDNWSFDLADIDHDGYADLVAINRKDGDRTAVHVLSFASNYQRFIVQVRTALHATDENWRLMTGDFDGDNRADLVAVNCKDGDKTAVHVLSFASNFQNFIVQVRTALHSTDANWDFGVANWTLEDRLDLVAINRRDGCKTSIHALSASSGYQQFVAHTVSGLHATNSDWEFSVCNKIPVCFTPWGCLRSALLSPNNSIRCEVGFDRNCSAGRDGRGERSRETRERSCRDTVADHAGRNR